MLNQKRKRRHQFLFEKNKAMNLFTWKRKLFGSDSSTHPTSIQLLC